MTGGGSPTVRRRRLAAELRRLRERADLTIEQVGARLGWSATKLSRMETVKVGASPKDVARLLDLYGVDGAKQQELLTLAREARRKGWWQAYGDSVPTEYATYIGLEAEAASMRMFAPQIVPGLLQTEDYARAVIGSALFMFPPGDTKRLVEVRMTRQARLREPGPLRVSAVLDEAALRRTIGSPEVMRAQLAHLRDLAALGNITLQLLPFDAGAHPATAGAFQILEFPEPDDPDVVCLESSSGSLYVEGEVDVFRYTLIFSHLQEKALDPGETVRRIAEMASEL